MRVKVEEWKVDLLESNRLQGRSEHEITCYKKVAFSVTRRIQLSKEVGGEIEKSEE